MLSVGVVISALFLTADLILSQPNGASSGSWQFNQDFITRMRNSNESQLGFCSSLFCPPGTSCSADVCYTAMQNCCANLQGVCCINATNSKIPAITGNCKTVDCEGEFSVFCDRPSCTTGKDCCWTTNGVCCNLKATPLTSVADLSLTSTSSTFVAEIPTVTEVAQVRNIVGETTKTEVGQTIVVTDRITANTDVRQSSRRTVTRKPVNLSTVSSIQSSSVSETPLQTVLVETSSIGGNRWTTPQFSSSDFTTNARSTVGIPETSLKTNHTAKIDFVTLRTEMPQTFLTERTPTTVPIIPRNEMPEMPPSTVQTTSGQITQRTEILQTDQTSITKPFSRMPNNLSETTTSEPLLRATLMKNISEFRTEDSHVPDLPTTEGRNWFTTAEILHTKSFTINSFLNHTSSPHTMVENLIRNPETLHLFTTTITNTLASSEKATSEPLNVRSTLKEINYTSTPVEQLTTTSRKESDVEISRTPMESIIQPSIKTSTSIKVADIQKNDSLCDGVPCSTDPPKLNSTIQISLLPTSSTLVLDAPMPYRIHCRDIHTCINTLQKIDGFLQNLTQV